MTLTVLQLGAQPRQLGVEVGQLDAERGRRRRASRRVSHGTAPARRLGRRAGERAGPGRGRTPPTARRASVDAVGVLAADAVQDAGDPALERAPDQLAGVGRERRRGERVDRRRPPTP